MKPQPIYRQLLYSFLFFLFLPNILVGQSKVDSLKSLISHQAEDTSKVSSLLALQEALLYEDPPSAAQAIQKALSLSEKTGFEKGKLLSLMALGDYLYINSKFDSALIVYAEAQIVAEVLEDRAYQVETLSSQAKSQSDLRNLAASDSLLNLALELAIKTPLDSPSVSLCYNGLGNNAFAYSKYDQALEMYQKTLAYNRSNQRREAVINMNIGLIYISQGDHDRANEYLQKGLSIAQQINDTRVMAHCSSYLGMVKRSLGEYEEAQAYYSQALAHYEKVKDFSGMAHVHTNISNIYKDLGALDQAIKELEKCLQVLTQTNFPLGECYTLNNLGELHFKMNDYQSAENYYLQAKKKSTDANVLQVSVDASRFLSQLYDSIGDYRNAYKYQVEYKILDDSLKNQANKSKISELEEKYQNQQKQKEIELLSAENLIAALEIQKQANLRNYLILAAVLLVLLIGVVYSRYQVKARANAKLKELDALKSNFFTNISHEFRTPLTLIQSPVQKLLNQDISKEAKEELTVIYRNATILTELTNQLLDLAKLEAGKLNLRLAKGDFQAFIKVLCASFESLAVAKNIDFEVDICDAPESAYFDLDKVQKILNNLLSNAFKFTSRGGQVQLKVQRKDDRLSIVVVDTGVGIPEAAQELVFNRFHQSESNDPHAAGTGVGLTLSKELAQLHKGDIFLESREGEGSKFTLEFPINPSAYHPSEIIAEEPEANFSSKKVLQNVVPNESAEVEASEKEPSEKIILVVEDNLDLQNHMSALLIDQYKVVPCSNGKQGIEEALKVIPDLIISDLMMPEADGVELCHTLKANEKSSHIPIILLTAKADRDTKLEGLKTGADDFLTKPFDNEELLVRVNNLLQQRDKLQSKYAQKLLLEPSKIQIESPDERFLKKALEVVNQNLANSAFTVEVFQQEMAMSRMQLHRKLKALTGFSASEFVRDLRLQRVSELILTHQMNIAESAYLCGFNNLSYFTQCFKDKFGSTPSQYAKNIA